MQSYSKRLPHVLTRADWPYLLAKTYAAAQSIDCRATCQVTLAQGTAVQLVATPDSGQQLSGWSGACSGTGESDVTLSFASMEISSDAGERLWDGHAAADVCDNRCMPPPLRNDLFLRACLRAAFPFGRAHPKREPLACLEHAGITS